LKTFSSDTRALEGLKIGAATIKITLKKEKADRRYALYRLSAFLALKFKL
jgi:hypothetical protein